MNGNMSGGTFATISDAISNRKPYKSLINFSPLNKLPGENKASQHKLVENNRVVLGFEKKI